MNDLCINFMTDKLHDSRTYLDVILVMKTDRQLIETTRSTIDGHTLNVVTYDQEHFRFEIIVAKSCLIYFPLWNCCPIFVYRCLEF